VNFLPPPPDLRTTGALPAVVDALLAHLDAERRTAAWEAPDAGLMLTPAGCLLSGEEYAPSPFEASGFRALVERYARSFPRGADLIERLSPATAAAVWAELYDPTSASRDGKTAGRVLVAERGVVPAIFAVYPGGYPADFNVGAVACAVAHALAEAPLHAELHYQAAEARLRLRVVLPQYALVVTACDLYGEPAPKVEVVVPGARGGADVVLGQPATQERRRRPGTGGETTAQGIVEKIHAAPAYYASSRS
jgi:hypothetical protein